MNRKTLIEYRNLMLCSKKDEMWLNINNKIRINGAIDLNRNDNYVNFLFYNPIKIENNSRAQLYHNNNFACEFNIPNVEDYIHITMPYSIESKDIDKNSFEIAMEGIINPNPKYAHIDVLTLNYETHQILVNDICHSYDDRNILLLDKIDDIKYIIKSTYVYKSYSYQTIKFDAPCKLKKIYILDLN